MNNQNKIGFTSIEEKPIQVPNSTWDSELTIIWGIKNRTERLVISSINDFEESQRRLKYLQEKIAQGYTVDRLFFNDKVGWDALNSYVKNLSNFRNVDWSPLYKVEVVKCSLEGQYDMQTWTYYPSRNIVIVKYLNNSTIS